ncbi:MAG TPA: glycosyltransferase [Pseudolysinimonas sp.]|nr:glycosyltransferase [Pseudolysinimonas sp.]
MIVAAAPAYATRHANPYNALLADALTAAGAEVREFRLDDLVRARPDIVHLHWPELLFLSTHRPWQAWVRVATFALLIRRARRRGTRLVWTVHNDGAHEERSSPRVRAALDRMLTRNVDAAFCLSEAGEHAARARLGEEVPVFRTRHGDYHGAYPFRADRVAARAELGIDPQARLVVAVGQVRPYKNLDHLIQVARRSPDALMRVAIAGAPDGQATADAVGRAAAGDPRIRLDFGHLDDARLAAWLAASDLVALPYRRILNSGAALLALSASRPVLVPALGAMPELAADLGGAWVRTYPRELTPGVLEDAVDWAMEERPDGPDLAAYRWGSIADETIAGYRLTLARPPR